MTTDPTRLTVALYDAIDAFQRTHRLPGLQHAQIRGLLAEHLARALPAVVPVPPPADQATLRERIAAAVDEGFRLYAELEDVSLGDSIVDSVLTAVLAVLPEQTDRATLREQIATVLRLHASLGGTPPQHQLPFFDGATPSLPRISGWKPLDEVADAVLAVLSDCPQCGDTGACNGGPCPLRRLAAEQPTETQAPRRRLAPSEHSAAWHAIEGAAGEEGADPGTVLKAVLWKLGIDAPDEHERPAVVERPDTQTREAEPCDGCGHPTHTANECPVTRYGEPCGCDEPIESRPAMADTTTEADPLCRCMHRRSQHIAVSGRLLCDVCDPESTENLVCEEFDAL